MAPFYMQVKPRSGTSCKTLLVRRALRRPPPYLNDPPTAPAGSSTARIQPCLFSSSRMSSMIVPGLSEELRLRKGRLRDAGKGFLR
jgi:hypothetical protein